MELVRQHFMRASRPRKPTMFLRYLRNGSSHLMLQTPPWEVLVVFTFCDMAKILHLYGMWFTPLNCKIVCYLLQLYQSICIYIYILCFYHTPCAIYRNQLLSVQPAHGFPLGTIQAGKLLIILAFQIFVPPLMGKRPTLLGGDVMGCHECQCHRCLGKNEVLHTCMIAYTPIKRTVGTWQWVCHGKGFVN